MIFKPGDQVLVDGNGPFTVQQSASSDGSYPISVNGDTFTPEGRLIAKTGRIRLQHYSPDSVTTYPLGKVQTLNDGIQIYHPTEGQPFQLTPTHKELL